MQSVYAITQTGNPDLQKEEKFLEASMENMYNLYLLVVSLLIEIRKKAEQQLVLSQKKYLATSEEKNPNKKFINNLLLNKLLGNKLLYAELEKRKLSWELDESYVDHVYQSILQSDEYQAYMALPKTSFETDIELVSVLFKEVVAVHPKLHEFIEDNRLTWLDDLPLVNTHILKMLEKVKPATPDGYFLPRLFKDDGDKLFAKELLKKTVLNFEKLQKEIEGKTPNWDTERIAEIDSILMKMAICEFLKFPSIPVKVTINEYVEIAKEYSTPKSSVFINGILDKLVKDYHANNSLNKTGRGLM